MTPEERELLQGMGNCYAACRASFEETLKMVGGSRSLSPEEVKTALTKLRKKYGTDREYKELRSRFPETFPV